MELALNGMDKVVLFATLAATLYIYFRDWAHRIPHPPGPKRLPLLGNLFDFPVKFGWETYASWGKEFDSDIIHLRAAGRDFIVLNSFKAATDLLDKKSRIYSSRPQFTMMHDLMGWEWLFVTMGYGEPWKERRRLFLQYLGNRKSHIYRPRQVEFVRTALIRILDDPEDFFNIIKHMAGGMSISLAYGLNVGVANDPFVDLAHRAFQTTLDASFPGAFLVDVIPWLKYVPEWVPGAGFKKTAREWKKLQVDFRELPFAEAIRNTALGTANPSLSSLSLEKLRDSPDNEHKQEIVKDTAGMVYGGKLISDFFASHSLIGLTKTAAADTTVSAITTFLVAMLYHPEIQTKAQNELDRVLQGRMPEFQDEQNVPYISALVKEVLRWRPVVPLGFPHQLTEDDVYKGYHIPKGSFVIANSWAMLQNEEEYPDSSSFKPERFLTEGGHLNSVVRDPYLMAFGFGRRICPGAHVATSILWLWITSFLTAFNISEALDEEGRPVEPSVQYQSGSVTCHPLPFKCTIKPRSKASEELVRSHIY